MVSIMAKSTTNNDNKFQKGNKKGNRFTSENQPSPEAKSKGHLKQRALKEIKEEIVYKSFSKVCEKLNSNDVTFEEVMDIFKKAIDISGFKSEKQEITQKEIKIEVANPEDKELLEGL